MTDKTCKNNFCWSHIFLFFFNVVSTEI